MVIIVLIVLLQISIVRVNENLITSIGHYVDELMVAEYFSLPENIF
ncbi:hypothetical protein KKE60_05475 [Patescibacteria group bacterium]|nr:hypothetical protein [Patescibacteria group bacterium]